MQHRNFAELCRAGLATIDELDDFVDAWHKSDARVAIYDFLGLTWEQYGWFVTDPASIKRFLAPGPIEFGDARDLFPRLANNFEALFDGACDLEDAPALRDPFPPAEPKRSPRLAS